jgi:NTP pyrophosphatase (non-canonical NTP hydrolase)
LADLDALTAELLAFRDARDWRQFHTLRQLIVSLNLEAGELLELTQWKSDAEIDALPADPVSAEALRDECADVLLYLLLIADKTGIDLLAAARSKLRKNAEKYPVHKARGSRAKYTELK